MDESLRFGHELLAQHAAIDQPTTFAMLGLEWDLLPGVFAPLFTGASGWFAERIPYPVGGTFLDVGCGMGIMTVCAARAGCAAAVGVDLDPNAVVNTARNVARHGVTDRAQAVQGDLFAPLSGKRFDMIFWNSNFIEVDSGFVHDDPLQRALFDPGYETHRRFFAEASRHLNSGGRLLLGFASFGSLPRLAEVAAEYGYRTTTLTEEIRPVPNPVRYLLLEFTSDK